jgi:hypothetical protein
MTDNQLDWVLLAIGMVGVCMVVAGICWLVVAK